MQHIPKSIKQAHTFFRSQNFEYDAYQSVIAAFFGPADPRCKHERICGQKEQVCGAIQAGCEIRPDLEDIIKQEFKEKSTVYKCGDLLGNGILSCNQCVNLVCTLLEDFQQPVDNYKPKQWFEEVEDINKVFK